MAEESQGSRQRIVAGAADMIRRRGLAATSVRELAAHAGTPLGSTYHYFPGGKQQLAAEAVRFAADAVTAVLEKELRAGPVAGLRAFLAWWRRTLVDSDYRAGCPVLAVAVEEPPADGTPQALAAAAEAFAVWEDVLARALRAHGTDAAEAAQSATLVVAAVEGAVALCRARRDTAPLDAVAARLEALLAR
ncbi:TetR/AcrR family transcriptional regulator [Thermobifida halotolerans]|uniref:TetR/AcrR family transcriptional regulator n=1 Tax=Thermobifida halotolerans TaxID=483545 RepID=A0AA97LYZ4_9ACTN|nr:TetR/AcrR family transcriptional regulator [Thermobifida halotolerans]UOE20613.1 TetR/AcrR family transcriptional regulator [Thermobifida halotolerans]